MCSWRRSQRHTISILTMSASPTHSPKVRHAISTICIITGSILSRQQRFAFLWFSIFSLHFYPQTTQSAPRRAWTWWAWVQTTMSRKIRPKNARNIARSAKTNQLFHLFTEARQEASNERISNRPQNTDAGQNQLRYYAFYCFYAKYHSLVIQFLVIRFRLQNYSTENRGAARFFPCRLHQSSRRMPRIGKTYSNFTASFQSHLLGLPALWFQCQARKS